MRILFITILAGTCLAAVPLLAEDYYPSAERDIYGNTIYTNASGTVTYRFLKNGGTQDALSSSNSACLASVENYALDAVFKSAFASVGGWLYAVKPGLKIIFN